MTIKKTEKGWLVDVRPNGAYGKRHRKILPTKSEAIRYKAWLLNETTKNPEWEPPKRDNRRLTDLIDIWYGNHGIHLKDNEKRLGKVTRICNELGNPYVSDFTAQQFLEYRSAKAEKYTANTLNHDLTYLKSIFNTLIKQKLVLKNPLDEIKPLKVDEAELTYLTKDQIIKLYEHLEDRRNRDALLITKLCLATGSRWSEAEKIKRNSVKQYSVTYTATKNGRNRTIPINEKLYNEILQGNGEGGRVFSNSYEAFSNALEESGIELPKGQRTHVLRHTFASHFIMNGGNLLTLQKILGHQTINMTMRYAHLAPDHLAEAIKYNPVADM